MDRSTTQSWTAHQLITVYQSMDTLPPYWLTIYEQCRELFIGILFFGGEDRGRCTLAGRILFPSLSFPVALSSYLLPLFFPFTGAHLRYHWGFGLESVVSSPGVSVSGVRGPVTFRGSCKCCSLWVEHHVKIVVHCTYECFEFLEYCVYFDENGRLFC